MRIAKGTVRCNFTDLFTPAFREESDNRIAVSVCEHCCAPLNNLSRVRELTV